MTYFLHVLTAQTLRQVMPMLGALLLYQYSVLLGPPPELHLAGSQGLGPRALTAADTQSLRVR